MAMSVCPVKGLLQTSTSEDPLKELEPFLQEHRFHMRRISRDPIKSRDSVVRRHVGRPEMQEPLSPASAMCSLGGLGSYIGTYCGLAAHEAAIRQLPLLHRTRQCVSFILLGRGDLLDNERPLFGLSAQALWLLLWKG